MELDMWRKSFLGWLLVLALTACDSGEQSASVVVSTSPEVATTLTVAPRPDPVQLAERYRGQDLTVLDLAELEEDGASVLALTFSMPLLAEQNFAQKIQVVDSENGLLDGAWELSDDLMMLRLRHIPPQRHLI